MENDVFKKLKILIEVLTHSGCNTLDESNLKELKKICKSSQENVLHVYALLMKELKKNNSQIRLSAFQICKELFKRSVVFRENVLRDLNIIFDLTTEINSKKLPPPRSSADSLKSLVLSALKTWVDEFGETYKKLKVAYNYFEKCKAVSFETLQVQNSTDQILENEQQRRLRTVNEEKIKKVWDEFKSNEAEIETTVTSLSNCLSLLLPPAEEFFIPEHNLEKISISDNLNSCDHSSTGSIHGNGGTAVDEGNEENADYLLANKNSLRECGISSNYNFSIQLELNDKFKITKTDENSSIIENAKDCVRLITNRFLPMVKKWIKIHCKCAESNSNNMKVILDVKEKLENILKKYNSLIFEKESPAVSDETDSDDDFEEVKKEGYEESVDFFEDAMLDCCGTKTSIQNFSEARPSTSKDFADPICKPDPVPICRPSTSKTEPGTSKSSKTNSEISDRKRKLLSVAPKLPYDIDLYHWEDENLSTPTLISTKIDVDKFWGCAGSDDIHEIPNPDGVASLRTRVIEFAGTFEPVKWACRAPLPNGKLCPRKDRYKCPFHGKIIARDEMGIPQDKDGEKTPAETPGNCTQDFQDPEFLSDIKAATGVDLTIPEKRGKKRKSEKTNLTHKKMKTSKGALKILESKKLPGLMDVVKKQNNAYTRLSKKVFNRSSLRRVSAVLNKLDRNKFRDKFGDQFNYS